MNENIKSIHATHDFRLSCVVTDEDGNRLFEYVCSDCDLEYVSNFILKVDDLEFHDYMSHVPCEADEEIIDNGQ